MVASLGKLKLLIRFFAYQDAIQPLGITKLYKLLYFADVAHLRVTGQTITGGEYLKYPYGPIPLQGERALQDLCNHHLVHEEHVLLADGRLLRKLTAPQMPNMALLTDPERETLDFVLKQYGEETALTLSNWSHQEAAWIQAADRRPLDPELMGYRDSEDDESLEAIVLLDEWYATPDEKGADYWDEFAQEVEANRIHLREDDAL